MEVEAIWVYCQRLYFSKEAMKNMKKLRILNISNRESRDSNFSYHGSIEYLSNNLCWIVWYDYLGKSLPSTFDPKNLVHLELRRSSLHYLWRETKQLSSLRTLDLKCSKSLVETPDFRGMPNLEYLDLSLCYRLEEVHYSLRCCSKLIRLDLNNCCSLKRFPCINVESLECLGLEYCSRLKEFPEIHGRMKPGIQINMQMSGLSESFVMINEASCSSGSKKQVESSVSSEIWFLHKGRDSSVSVNLPENWYIPDKFLGFAVCYDGSSVDTTAQLIPVCYDRMSCMTKKLALSECDTESFYYTEWDIHFFLVPLAVLWDTSKANGRTPNDYGIIRLSFSGEEKMYGLRLLYKEEAEVEAFSQMRENNNEGGPDKTIVKASS